MKTLKKQKSLKKLSNRGFKGYPVATIAYYGPDDQNATKVSARSWGSPIKGIVKRKNTSPLKK